MGTPEYNAEWFAQHPGYGTSKSRFYRRKKRLQLINDFGACCAHCGYDNIIALDFDHIFNDGYLVRGKTGSGSDRLIEIEKSPSRFQLLCKNCNWIKEYERRQNAQRLKKAAQLHGSNSPFPVICTEGGSAAVGG